MFEDKVIVITGAGSGIGRALAINFANRGSKLAISDINPETLRETVAMLPDKTQVKAYDIDVSSRDAVYDFVESVAVDFGAIHFLINNAGTSIFGTVNNITDQEIQKVIDINMWGVVHGCKAALPIMLKQQEGCIVNISSVFGLVGTPCSVAYTMSKFAVRGFTETLWGELAGTGVRAVVVHPGGINTGIKDASPVGVNGGEFERRVVNANLGNLNTSPEDCAEQIIVGLRKGKSRLLVGHGAKALHWISRVFPNSYLKVMGKTVGL